MVFSKTFLAAFGLTAVANAHMILHSPTPFALDGATLNSSPLDANGDNFPCKIGSGITLKQGSASNSMALGSTQPLTFTGSAVHGGGSCQISLTTDAVPTKNSVWKVIYSIEGGCPAQNQTGNFPDAPAQLDPDTYSFSVPSNIPAGTYTLAWTWFNKIGNREMYMNCAPATLTGTGGSQANFDALPDMFVANVGNGCGTVDSKDVLFPNAGSAVESLNGATSAFAAPTGSSCQAGSGSSGGTTTAVAATQAASSKTSATSAAANTNTAGTAPGGIFITVSGSGSGSGAATAATTVATSATSVATTAPAAQATSSSTSSSSTSSTSSSSSGALSGACSTEGEWNCIGGTSFQQCASGQWSVVQQLAAGTSCTAGQSSAINIVGTSGKTRRVAMRFHS